MSITAIVENDVIKLPEGTHLEDGTKVLIVPQPKGGGSFAQRHAHLIGAVGSGVGDLAENHDYYLYGAPKKSRP